MSIRNSRVPKVNFYLLKQASDEARLLLACKLSDQLSRQGQRVYLLLGSAAEVAEFDQLLWSFAPESFVPHAMLDAVGAAQAPVLIGNTVAAPPGCSSVINLSGEAVPAQPGVATIAEFVLNEPAAKARGRALWNVYKEAGCELQHHQL